MAWIFVPLCAVVATAAATQFVGARAMHRDVRRLFEELREVAVARTLADEMRGIATWVQAAPNATAADQPLAVADVRQHHAAATATLTQFTSADDPSRHAHDDVEHAIVARVAVALAGVGERLEREPLGALATPVAAARADALALIAAIEGEVREVGEHLDRRSGDMAQFVLVLGLASLATIGGLGLWLLRRVLRPVRALRAAAARLGRGELDVPMAATADDELGDLARTFQTMADALRRHHRDLEARVAQRSKEVLRSAKLAQLGTLAAGIAHEINNPLASIVAGADGLLREVAAAPTGVSSELRDYLQILRKEAMRARDITVRLLRFSRQDQGQRVPVDVLAEAREVAALFRRQLEDAGVALRIDPDDGSPALSRQVLGDPAEWRQVLFNLLRNALDASPRGGAIELACRRQGDTVEIVVRDEGPGIPAADLERIFEPFFTTKEPGQGTGLGLAIVHRIVTAHGGTVQAANTGRGAAFTISVPAFEP